MADVNREPWTRFYQSNEGRVQAVPAALCVLPLQSFSLLRKGWLSTWSFKNVVK